MNYGQAVQGGEPQVYNTDLHRRTELADASATYTKNQYKSESDTNMMMRNAAFKATIRLVLGDDWMYMPRRTSQEKRGF